MGKLTMSLGALAFEERYGQRLITNVLGEVLPNHHVQVRFGKTREQVWKHPTFHYVLTRDAATPPLRSVECSVASLLPMTADEDAPEFHPELISLSVQ
jgi:hypothetical protein